MSLRLFNTLHRAVEAFHPLHAHRPTMYVCGPTVYNYVHIGNARGPVVFDVLAQLLQRRYGNVLYVRNITDIDDKIITAAQENGVSIAEITNTYTAAYRQDMEQLGVKPPNIEPTATTHIPHIIAMITQLVQFGHAYVHDGHVLFSVASFAYYGSLSRKDTTQTIAGARVEVAPYKRAPNDFVLWKPSTSDQPGWDSPWGRGRPGWHIECSAMAATHLGKTIDIHAGGVDLEFPHHENEIAQSQCAHQGQQFVRFWLHNGMLTFNGSKMSKSLGNIETVRALLAKHPAETLRLALLSAHYRQPLDWSEGLLIQTQKTLDRLYATLRAAQHLDAEPVIPEEVEHALDNDLNTPQALAIVSQTATQLRSALEQTHTASPNTDPKLIALKSKLLGSGKALGLLQCTPEDWRDQPHKQHQTIDTAWIEDQITQRNAARKQKAFEVADAIRVKLAEKGIIIEDTAQGTQWRRQ